MKVFLLTDVSGLNWDDSLLTYKADWLTAVAHTCVQGVADQTFSIAVCLSLSHTWRRAKLTGQGKKHKKSETKTWLLYQPDFFFPLIKILLATPFVTPGSATCLILPDDQHGMCVSGCKVTGDRFLAKRICQSLLIASQNDVHFSAFLCVFQWIPCHARSAALALWGSACPAVQRPALPTPALAILEPWVGHLLIVLNITASEHRNESHKLYLSTFTNVSEDIPDVLSCQNKVGCGGSWVTVENY